MVSLQGLVGLPILLRRFWNTLRSLCLSGQHLPAAAAGYYQAEVFSPLCLYAAVLGLTTRLYHARVHVVIQNGEEFPRMP